MIHGYRTIFPIPLAEASSWDPSLAERSASIAAQEARAMCRSALDLCADARYRTGPLAPGRITEKVRAKIATSALPSHARAYADFRAVITRAGKFLRAPNAGWLMAPRKAGVINTTKSLRKHFANLLPPI